MRAMVFGKDGELRETDDQDTRTEKEIEKAREAAGSDVKRDVRDIANAFGRKSGPTFAEVNRGQAKAKAAKAVRTRNEGQREAASIMEKYPSKGTRTESTQKFAEGGMVRGCKSIQTSGKGFKGTF